MGYYLANDGTQAGPYELADLLSKGLKPDSLVWTEGMADWQAAATVPEVAALLAAPAEVGAGESNAVNPVSASVPFPPGVAGTTSSPPSARPNMMAYRTANQDPGNGLAVASMVLGIVSFPLLIFYCAGFITAILAIVFGFIARGKIHRGETQVGKGMATAGIIMGVIYFVLAIALIGLFTAITVYSAKNA